MGTHPSSPKRGRSLPPQFSAHFYCGRTAGWIKMPLGTMVGLSPGDYVLDGNTAPSHKGVELPPQFSAHFYCGQTAGCIKMTLGMEVELGPVHIVLDGDTAPLPKREQSPQFSAHLYLWQNCWMHQDATWYGGRPQPRRLCVRWGPSPYPKVAEPHPIFGPRLLWPNDCMDQENFGPCLLWPNGWMDEDAAWYESRPRLRPHCSRRGPSFREGAQQLPSFRPICLLWPPSPISATAELLFALS